MSEFNSQYFTILQKDFITVTKRVLQNRLVSSRKEKIREFTTELILNYNKLLTYANSHIEEVEREHANTIIVKVTHCRELY